MDKAKCLKKSTRGKRLHIVNDDYTYNMEDASAVSQNISKDFGSPWFLSSENNLPYIAPHDSVSQISSTLDNKAKVELAQLKDKINLLKEKHEIEQAKFDIRKREELLELKMEFAMTAAKIDMDSSNSEIENQCNSKVYQTEALNNHPSTPPACNSSYTLPVKTEHHDPVRSNLNSSSSSEKTTEDIVMSVVREMKKPKTEIKKFSGADMTLYRKFIRQFNYFTSSVDSFDEKMNLLDYYTTGEANRIITGYGHMDSAVGFPAGLKELEERYGDPEATAATYAERALEWTKIAADDPKGLDDFGIFLSECEAAVQNFEDVKVLENKKNMQILLKKLPYSMHEKWRNLYQSLKDKEEKVTFHHFVKFVKREAKKATDPTYGREALSDDRNKHFKGQRKVRVLATSMSQDTDKTVRECSFCKKQNHSLSECHQILKKTYQERIDFLKSVRLCFGCLKEGHSIKYCKTKLKCDTCSRWHPTILHDQEFHEKHLNKSVTTACSESTEAGEGVCTMNIIPVIVRLKGGNKLIQTYAFRDNGSSATFCTTNLMRQLGIMGKRKIITLNTMGLPYNMATYVLHNLEILDLDMKNVVFLPKVYTKDKMPVNHDLIPTEADIANWKHLENVKLPQIDAEIGLLIGNRIADAYTPLEVVRGESGSPHASRTALGWMVWNVVRQNKADSTQTVNNIIVNRCQVNAVGEIDQLETLVHRSINLDFPEKSTDEKPENSIEDKRFINMVDSSMRHTENGHYEIGLPFKTNNFVLPDNISQAEQRLKYLKKKLDRNPQFKEDYTAFMNKIIDKGFAVKVNEEEPQSQRNVWYIPHHGVYNPNKPNIRVVFDCSAKFHGISLNHMLLSGPDLTSKLINVLLRFRQEEIALMADITSMYYMVNVPEKDTDYLRFLWYPNGNTESNPCIYKMTVHLFGATSSPSCAISALQRTSQDFENESNVEAAKTLRRNFYVDDCLRSVPSESQAIKLVRDLKEICSNGGFELSKWMSNSRHVLETIPDEHHAKGLKDLNLDNDELPVERALGVYWAAETDTLGFKITLQSKPATKRGILSTICSIYDPLGLAAPLILPAKIILQNLCQLKVQWDEQIPDNILQQWNQWLFHLPNLQQVSLPRCYKPTSFGRVKSCQLHSFSDASESGYGAAIYLRQISEDDIIHCSLVLGKSRVTPLKRITIPRLELTAAVTSLRLSQMVIKQLDIDFADTDIFYWTDSYSVLRYLANTSTRFQTFVANRVDIIRDSSQLSQWRYVDSKSNPADEFSRGISGRQCTSNMRWLQGPTFLWKPDTEWPVTELNLALPNNDSEVKKVQLITTATDVDNSSSNIMDRILHYHSSWFKLKKMVAWLIVGMKNLQYWAQKRKQINTSLLEEEKDLKKRTDLVNGRIDRLKKNSFPSKNNYPILSLESLEDAESRILKYVQRQNFPNEIANLQKSSTVTRESTLLKLDPYLENGLIRVGGRLQRSNLSYDMKHPIILPKDSFVSELILQEIHQKVGHFGKNSMLSKLREQYWLPRANTAIRSLVSKCVTCRHYRAKVGEQKMADLPVERVIGDEPPFTVTGVDYFGPYEIKQGRSVVKRYGVVFTCLKSRAIHIEMAYSLDTDACVNVIRRFTNRRGPVRIMKSDNGSNFISTNKELKAEFKKLDQQRLQHLFLNDSIKWEFNPPTASHFGGIWERQIRTIRKLLFALMKEQCIRLSDDSLQTLFSEIENIINSRPLTVCSEDPNDFKVLTPNNLLLFNNSGSFPLGTFQKTDNYARRKWRQIQYLADIFWKRWSEEYLSMLQERQKWFIPKRNLVKDDIVLLVDNTVSRNSWCLGKVTEVKTDKHGLVRVVKVKSKNSEFNRPIDKLVLLLEADTKL